MMRDHEGGIIGRGIVEKESLRSMWEAFGRHLADIWEAPGDSQMLQEDPESSRKLHEALEAKHRCLSRLEYKSCI